jgi:ATP-binding cassette subfamily F protein 3
MHTSEARDYLARFLFAGDDVFKPVSALSGGERSRLALALLMTRDVNFLLLDEPTTHLDIPSQEVLQSVLSEFDGTILLVTHDRYLVSRLATQVWGLEGDRLRVYDGGYDEYLAERERNELARRTTRTGNRRRAARPQGRRPARRAQQVATLEQAIADLEARLVSLGLELQAAGATRQFDKLRQLGLEYGAVESDLEGRMAEWTDVADG